ncbi:hypothetical protein TELCIR_04612 [Teladorsagia circumcincta]|uniref:Uncharacterized protein n=1 Tax=Teladorsagia circumcincta TaxID=45464 RepID=A0A2G9UT41_TELCI|nr:hypothetical protein TELCIR_04612 [Teladorsagia circumcincta]
MESTGIIAADHTTCALIERRKCSRACGAACHDQVAGNKANCKPTKEKSYSEESVQGAAKLSDFASDLVQLSKLSTAAPRLDAEAKQARIIEAIYQASGREVPEMYKSKVHQSLQHPTYHKER